MNPAGEAAAAVAVAAAAAAGRGSCFAAASGGERDRLRAEAGREGEEGLAMEADAGWVRLLGRREDGGTARARVAVAQPKDQRDQGALSQALVRAAEQVHQEEVVDYATVVD